MLDENSFLKKVLSNLGKENLLQGNEDAVALEIHFEKSDILIINTDSMSWSSDALPPTISYFEFGKKLVTMTVSDVIAKEGILSIFYPLYQLPKQLMNLKYMK